jgi:hypothetical protein
MWHNLWHKKELNRPAVCRPGEYCVIIKLASQGGAGLNGSARGLLLIGMTCFAAGCCLLCPKAIEDWPAQKGVVVDTDTGEPLAGAYVIGRWRGYVSSHSVCFHAEGTRTDSQGRFVLPAWRNTGPYNNTSHQQYYSQAYFPGYEDVGGRTDRLELKRFTGTREERLQSLTRVATGSACDPQAGVSVRNLFPLYEAIYQEAKEMSETPEELKELEWFRYIAVDMAIASDTLISSPVEHKAKINSYLKDHLK